MEKSIKFCKHNRDYVECSCNPESCTKDTDCAFQGAKGIAGIKKTTNHQLTGFIDGVRQVTFTPVMGYLRCSRCYRYKQEGGMCLKKGHVLDCSGCEEYAL
jgi:hypothetical protein